jgi:hypothetical protein
MKILTKLITLLFMLAFSSSAIAASTTDLWDESQGVTVLGTSGVQAGTHYSDIRNMFGGDYGYPETYNTIFADYQPAGTVHWVEWKTTSPVNLMSFELAMAHDADDRDANYRGVATFRLYYRDGSGNLVKVFEISPANPYADTEAPPNATVTTNGYNSLTLCANVGSVVAQSFYAEFVQYGDPSHASGPRIMELDGFASGCPGIVTDSDGDGVLDDADLCPATPLYEVVNSDGCSIEQLVPCEDATKHGSYVKEVMQVANDFLEEGLISRADKRQIVSDAGKSDCGK